MDRPQYLTGHLLISETELEDPNFKETVIFIVDHSDEGAFGLVVNRKSDSILGEAFEEFADHPAASIPIYVGGPVEPQYLFILHSGLPSELQSEHAREPLGDVVFEPDFKPVSEYLRGSWLERDPEDKGEIKFFAGYAGWGAGQLEEELKTNSWVILPGADELIFASHPEEGWRQALRKKGGIYWVAAETGYKPSLN
jgi:putative transcriptional regulator